MELKADKKDKTILIVDDSESMRELLDLLLRREGYTTILARDGKEALRMLSEGAVSLVVSDYHMPVIHGLNFVKLLRSHPEYRAHRFLPVIMMTADDETASVTHHHGGITLYMPKSELKARLPAALEKLIWRPKDNSPASPGSEDSLS